MAQAARVGDRITHTNAYAGLVAGALAGAAIAGLCIATGGAALPAIAIAAAGGAGLGGVIGEFAAGFTTSDTGMIVDGSGDVNTNARRAARAGDPVTCSWHAGAQRVAEGSATVLVDGLPAARLGDRTTCGAQIASGSGNVDIGGPTRTVLGVNPEVPLVAELAVLGLGLISGAGEIALAADGLKLARATQLAKGLAGGLGFGTAGSIAGGAIWGQGSRGQRQLALGSGLFGAGLASGLLAGRTDPMGVGVAADDAAAGALSGAADDPVAAATAKLNAARTPTEIEEARGTVKGLDYADRKAVLNDYAARMDVSSQPNTATLYSGGRAMPTGPGGRATVDAGPFLGGRRIGPRPRHAGADGGRASAGRCGRVPRRRPAAHPRRRRRSLGDGIPALC